jgi:hypothetical protein
LACKRRLLEVVCYCHDQQARVLKPGGISFVAVDTILTGHDNEPGNGYTPAQLELAIFRPARESGLELVGDPVDWGLTPSTLATAIFGGALWICILGTGGVKAAVCDVHDK